MIFSGPAAAPAARVSVCVRCCVRAFERVPVEEKKRPRAQFLHLASRVFMDDPRQNNLAFFSMYTFFLGVGMGLQKVTSNLDRSLFGFCTNTRRVQGSYNIDVVMNRPLRDSRIPFA